MRLSRFINGKIAPTAVVFTTGDLEARGKLDTRFLATTPKNGNLYVVLSPHSADGTPKGTDTIVSVSKSSGKLGRRAFTVSAKSYINFAVVP